jgi:hypothetical protein
VLPRAYGGAPCRGRGRGQLVPVSFGAFVVAVGVHAAASNRHARLSTETLLERRVRWLGLLEPIQATVRRARLEREGTRFYHKIVVPLEHTGGAVVFSMNGMTEGRTIKSVSEHMCEECSMYLSVNVLFFI